MLQAEDGVSEDPDHIVQILDRVLDPAAHRRGCYRRGALQAQADCVDPLDNLVANLGSDTLAVPPDGAVYVMVWRRNGALGGDNRTSFWRLDAVKSAGTRPSPTAGSTTGTPTSLPSHPAISLVGKTGRAT